MIASASQARGLLDNNKLESRFTVDTSAGPPESWSSAFAIPSPRSPDSSAWALAGDFEAKAVMQMEGAAPVASGSQHWNGGSCIPPDTSTIRAGPHGTATLSVPATSPVVKERGASMAIFALLIPVVFGSVAMAVDTASCSTSGSS